MPLQNLQKKKRSWNRLKDLYFIWLVRHRYRWWHKEVTRREQAAEPLGVWLYLVKKFVIERTQYFTPANIMSLCRGILAYPMYLLFVEGYTLAGLFVFVVAELTDFFDGHLARAFNQETISGKLGDPFFDKVLHGTAIMALLSLGIVPVWLTIGILGLDLILVIMAVILKPFMTALGIKREVGANEYGKWKFLCQGIALTCFFLSLMIGVATSIGSVVNWVGIVFGSLSLLLAVGSIIEHVSPGCLKGSPDSFVQLKCSPHR